MERFPRAHPAYFPYRAKLSAGAGAPNNNVIHVKGLEVTMTAAGSSRDGALTPLASDFERATREQWLTLVDKAIKGADFEKRLVTRTADGIRVEPLYTREGASPALQDAGPGQAPFTRGARSSVDGLGWEIRQRIAATDPARANTEIMTELDGGTNGILLEIEAPGQAGCRIASATDMAAALEGMRLDLAPVELNAGLAASDAARHFLAALPTLSVGIAAFPAHGNHTDALLRAADRALYRSKRAGRDQVRVAED